MLAEVAKKKKKRQNLQLQILPEKNQKAEGEIHKDHKGVFSASFFKESQNSFQLRD